MVTVRLEKVGPDILEEIEWPAEELDIVEKPSGPATAALLAAGIGALTLGVATVLSEASVPIHDWLTFSSPVGPLSGKVTLAVLAYLLSWAVLAVMLRGRDMPLRNTLIATGLLVAAGFIGTFPKFFGLFAGG